MEDTWGMMVWLTKYIEENKSEWERRRRIPPENEYEKWTGMDEEEMTRALNESEAKEAAMKETKKEKAARRKQYWKDWSQGERIDKEPENEEDGEVETAAAPDNKDKMTEYMERNQEMKKKRKDWKEEKETWRTTRISVSKLSKN